MQRTTRSLAVIAFGAALGLGITVAPANAASPQVAATSPTTITITAIGIAANDCSLPTHATPPSRFIRSFPRCRTCLGQALHDTEVLPGGPYYCTYNPSNGLTDEHQYLG